MSPVQILAPVPPALQEVLSPAALEFVVDLERRFGPRRRELLAARVARQQRLDAGESLDFLASTAEFALVIRSDLKRQRLGSILMDKLVRYAREIGIQRLVGEVMGENEAAVADRLVEMFQTHFDFPPAAEA